MNKHNFNYWHDYVADMPQKVDGVWVDLETGLAYRNTYSYAGERSVKPNAALSEKARAARVAAKAFGGKALIGTAKQKNWAEEIRAGVLKQVTLEQAQKLCSERGVGRKAAFWIFNRKKSAHDIGQFIDHQKALFAEICALREQVRAGDINKKAEFDKKIDEYNYLTLRWGCR